MSAQTAGGSDLPRKPEALPESVRTSGTPDIEGVLAGHEIGHERRAYPAYACLCGWDGAQGDDGSETDGQNDTAEAARAHVAAVLREQITAAQAEAWETGHRLGEALAYNAVGDILWERHRDVIARSEYARHRAARVEQLPHWDANPYRAAQVAPSRVPGEHRTFHCDRCHQPAMNIDANGLCRACRVPGGGS